MAKAKKTQRKRWDNYQDYLRSPEWKKLRKKTIERVKTETGNPEALCEICDSSEKLQVHHLEYPEDWNDDHQDFHVLLCEECHKNVHIYFNDNSFDSRYDFMIKTLKMKCQMANDAKIEFYSLFGIAVTNKNLRLSKRWNANTKSFDGLLELNGYAIHPPFDKYVIDIFKKRD